MGEPTDWPPKHPSLCNPLQPTHLQSIVKAQYIHVIMSGTGNEKNKSKQQKPQHIVTQSTIPVNPDPPKAKLPIIACQTLDMDEVTRCGKPATQGNSTPKRCRVHQKQYRKLCGKYKDASKVVDEIRKGGQMPSKDDIARYTSVPQLLEKSRLVRKFVEANRIERTGRGIHGRRFFLKSESKAL